MVFLLFIEQLSNYKNAVFARLLYAINHEIMAEDGSSRRTESEIIKDKDDSNWKAVQKKKSSVAENRYQLKYDKENLVSNGIYQDLFTPRCQNAKKMFDRIYKIYKIISPKAIGYAPPSFQGVYL